MATATFSLTSPVALAPMPRATPAVAETGPTLAPTTYTVVSTRADFDALGADWDALFARAGRSDQMFMQFNWLWHWTNHYLGADDRLVIVTARRAGRLVLVLPLVAERVATLTQLAFMGAPVSQYGDVLVDDVADRADLLDGAWTHLMSNVRFDVMRLAKVRDDALIAPLLQRSGFAVTAAEEAPFARLSNCAGFTDLEGRLSAKHRRNRRRQVRRLEERGPLEVRVLEGGAEARDAVRLTMTLKRAWLNQKALISTAFKDERIDRFFADAIDSPTHRCGVSLSLLKSAGEGCDANVSITCKGRRAVHILAYGLKFDKLGVGNHHLDVNLQRACDEGIETYDFLAPRHEYKMEWADGTVFVRDHTLAVSPLGRLYMDLYVARVREGLKRVLARLPAGLRRLIAGTHTTVA